METGISKAGNEYGLDIYDNDGKYVGWICQEDLEDLTIEIEKLNENIIRIGQGELSPIFNHAKWNKIVMNGKLPKLKYTGCKVVHQNNSRVRSSKNYDGLRTIGYCQVCKKAIKTFNKQAVEGTDFSFKNEKICCMRCK